MSIEVTNEMIDTVWGKLPSEVQEAVSRNDQSYQKWKKLEAATGRISKE